jgi:hypothetical protein
MSFNRIMQRGALKPRETQWPCDCSPSKIDIHPNMAHWSPDGHCVVPKCKCKKYSRKRLNKYNAAKTEIRGQHFDSKLEGKVATDLRYLEMAGQNDLVEIERQKEFRFIHNGVHICSYYADFFGRKKDGRQPVVVEAKGMRMDGYRIKKKLMAAFYPEVEFREVRERGF